MKTENSTNPLLSISLLTSNRKDTIRKCLDSLDALRRAVPSELIIVDTGCDDEMRGIIEAYTDHILRFTWIGDFSAARNVGLSEAKGEWFLFIDDDEWFEETDEIEQFFLSGEYKEYDSAYYLKRNYRDFAGTLWKDFWASRMRRLEAGICFRGKIHEYLPIGKRKKYLHSYVHHYGYVYRTEEERIAHSKRNIVPLEEEIREDPRNLRWHKQLAQEYLGIQEYEKTLEVAKQGLRLLGADRSKTALTERAAFHTCVLISFLQKEQYREAAEYIRKEQYNKNSDLGKLILYGAGTDLYFRQMDFPKAVEYGQNYVKQYKKLEEMSDQERNEQQTIIADLYYKDLAAKNSTLCYLFVSALRLGDTRPLEDYFSMLDFSGEHVYLAANLIGELLRAMQHFESPWFYEVAPFLLQQQGTVAGEIVRILEQKEQAGEPGFENLVKIFAACDSDLPYIRHLQELRELYALADSICENARKLWDQGNAASARSLMQQLKQLVPGYPRTDALVQQFAQS
jgi:glycosyltransferase involved in cell wall biosynthesis